VTDVRGNAHSAGREHVRTDVRANVRDSRDSWRRLDDLDPLRAGAGLLLTVHAFHGIGVAYCQVTVMAIVAVCLVSSRALLQPVTWWLLVATSAIALADQWALADNHKFLLLYATLALAQAVTWSGDGLALLSRSSRYLLIFVFTASAAQKLLSQPFLRGDVFEYLLLTDARMTGLSALLGIPAAVVQRNGDALSCARSAAPVDGAILLAGGTPLVAAAAEFFTTADVALPAFAAVGLLARSRPLRSAGYLATIVFIATTYAVAPVYGFGWLLCVLGYWASADDRPRDARLFLAAYALLIVYHLPVHQLAAMF
jgi:hypothetical protein